MKKTILPLFLGLLLVFASVKPVAADAMFLFRVVDTVHGNAELAQTDPYTITLVGKVDHVTYTASSWFAGYNNPGCFLPTTQGYDITVECTIGGNQFRKTVSADASLFTSARRFTINLTEAEWLNAPVYFDAYFQVQDSAGDPVPYATVIVSPDLGATTLRGYADENGCATVNLPESTHNYFVGAGTVYGAPEPSLATLRATTAAAPYIVTVTTLPTHEEITGLTQTIETYVDGALFKSLTTNPLYHDASAAIVSALTDETALLFDAGIAGFEHGAFRLTMTVALGGDDDTLKGTAASPDLNPSFFVYENTMIHDDMTVRWLYFFVPDLKLSFANLAGDGAVEETGDFAPIYTRDGALTLPAAAPARDGFIFAGWQTAPDAELLAPGADEGILLYTGLAALALAGCGGLALAGCGALRPGKKRKA